MKRVIVTGATGGLGWAISECLAERGVQVIGTYCQATDEKVSAWKSGIRNGQIHRVDISCEEQVSTFAEAVLRDETPVSGLVNNAGITRDAFFLKMTSQQWREVMEVNLLALFFITQPVFAHFAKNGGGRIVNVSSINAQRGQSGQANYCAAKAGTTGLTKALALEGARYGICVNTVSPGYIETPMTEKIRPDILDQIKKQIPMQRLALPQEVASTVAYLLGPDSSYINGADISVNGGHHIQ